MGSASGDIRPSDRRSEAEGGRSPHRTLSPDHNRGDDHHDRDDDRGGDPGDEKTSSLLQSGAILFRRRSFKRKLVPATIWRWTSNTCVNMVNMVRMSAKLDANV